MSTRVNGLWTVILAAGGSSRLRRPKQLLRLRGETLIKHTADLAQQLTPERVVAVVGALPFRMRSALHASRGRCSIVTNPEWRGGMSSSLARGLKALPANAAAALVLVTDQPRVTASTLARLIAAWTRYPHRAAAAAYSGRVGVPAILPRRLWREACRAGGDAGARAVLRLRGRRITVVPLPDAATDIDT